MLKKLLKYDIKNMYKFLSVFYILMIVFAILTRLLFNMKQTVIISILQQISIGAMFSMIASSLINVLMRNWVRFKQTLYADESYLTHTLPVSKTILFESKFVLSFINVLTTFIVIVISLLIAYYTKERFDVLYSMINSFAGLYGISCSLFIMFCVIILFLEFFSGLQAGFLGIILGHRKNENKTALSVIYGLIIYFISQIIVILILYVIGIFNKDIMLIFTDNKILNASVIKNIIIICILIYSFIVFLINMLCVKVFKSGVNVD